MPDSTLIWPLKRRPATNARIILASQGIRIWTALCRIEEFGESMRLACSDASTIDNLRKQHRVAFTIVDGTNTIQGNGMATVSATTTDSQTIIVDPYRVSADGETYELRLKGWTKVEETPPPDTSRFAFWYQAFRLVTLPLSALPVLLGGMAAFAQGHVSVSLLALSFIGAVSAHAGANAAADYFDFKNGVDSSRALSSHLGALARERVDPEMILLAAFGCFMITALSGLVLLQASGWRLLFFGLAGLLGAFFYTGRPISYKYRALGELMLGILVGPVIVMGAYFVQTGGWNWAVFLLSTSLGMLISSISLVNNLRDMPDDKASGIHTLPMLLGVSNTKRLYYILTFAPYLAAAGAVIMVHDFWPIGLAVISVPQAVVAVRALSSTKDNIDQIREKALSNPYPLNSIRLHSRFGALAVVGLLVAGIIKLVS